MSARRQQESPRGRDEDAAQRERAGERLTAAGISPTPQRIEIARILLARPQHLSAEQILTRVKAGGIAVSKATVYNTLGLFARKGLVREVVVDPNKVFYDSNVTDHHHFYDVESCTLTDIDAEAIEIGRLPRAPAGREMAGVDVIVRIRKPSGRTPGKPSE